MQTWVFLFNLVLNNVLFVVICSYLAILRSNNTKGGYCNICAIVNLFCVSNMTEKTYFWGIFIFVTSTLGVTFLKLRFLNEVVYNPAFACQQDFSYHW